MRLATYAFRSARHTLPYVQGQRPDPRTREYFYYVDHNGMLFQDDARTKNFTSRLKEVRFLKAFYEALRRNDTGRYSSAFPFVSPCGRERNYVRCDDRPIVFTHLLDGERALSYGHAGDSLALPFEPELLVSSAEGRLYHPAPERCGGIGLVSSALAADLSRRFAFDRGEHEPPTRVLHAGEWRPLRREWYDAAQETV